MKLVARCLLGLAIVLAALLFGRNFIIKKAVEKGLRAARGFDASIGSIEIGLFRPVIRIRDAVITNPPDFPRKECLNIKEITVQYQLASFFGSEIHFSEIVVDVPRAVVVWKGDGELNFDRMAGGGKKEKAESDRGNGHGTNEVKKTARTLLVDTLTLRIAEAQVFDYRKGPEPRVMTLPIKLDRTYTEVRNVRTLAAKLAAELTANYVASIFGNVGDKMKKNGDTDKLHKMFDNIGKSVQQLFKKKSD